jgi:hypothetical protein
MPEYRAYTLDGDGRITAAAKMVACADDTLAMEFAATLAREVAAPIEVWESARRVGCVQSNQRE